MSYSSRSLIYNKFDYDKVPHISLNCSVNSKNIKICNFDKEIQFFNNKFLKQNDKVIKCSGNKWKYKISWKHI